MARDSRHGCSEFRRGLRLGNHLIAVDGVDSGIPVSVEYDGRNNVSGPTGSSPNLRPALPHSCEGRSYVAGSATRQSRMHADRGIEFWVGCTHYCRCGTSSREPGDIYASRLDTEVAHD